MFQLLVLHLLIIHLFNDSRHYDINTPLEISCFRGHELIVDELLLCVFVFVFVFNFSNGTPDKKYQNVLFSCN